MSLRDKPVTWEAAENLGHAVKAAEAGSLPMHAASLLAVLELPPLPERVRAPLLPSSTCEEPVCLAAQLSAALKLMERVDPHHAHPCLALVACACWPLRRPAE